jgi:hypothetical protein
MEYDDILFRASNCMAKNFLGESRILGRNDIKLFIDEKDEGAKCRCYGYVL